MHRSRASNQCDLEHPNVNDIRRNGKLPVDPARRRQAWHILNGIHGTVRALARRPRLWAERRRQRRTLGELADEQHLLDDIGLTRAQALDEAAKPFWRQ